MIHIIAVDGLGLFSALGFDLRAFIFFAVGKYQLITLGTLVLVFRNGALFIHGLQEVLLPFLIGLRVIQGIIGGRRLGNGCQTGTLRRIQILNVLAKVLLCGGLHTVAAIGQVHSVQVRLNDLVFAVIALQVQRLQDLVKLTDKGHLVFVR